MDRGVHLAKGSHIRDEHGAPECLSVGIVEFAA
jgi:hypothetical protein